ncbi:TraM recognition domain-containing protein [Clostridium perfringens]|uniref:TraM recognition domain-containing protein n=1 Tax=Clostridium perfringens TaxID=1502 RepID=UPI00155DD086|nr:type IV secretory system conjugative DNA transfer family protein [Clostridium perfringens]MBI6029634.1 type IV secretory system conjugative DNA transfer family protein [Clostridium perfringens]MBI6033013.1 type IV secretory system conjugative DNA transfer family protein [Clostridium perfringens]MDM0701385.1 TraM recognition domain-containing protein [Clostridium perfringens]MDV5113381.1 TraM recognition domain-containing protein [Clostridium perfringens]UUR88490.1 TraM recognition domain-co
MRIIKNKEDLFSIIKNSNNLIISLDSSGTEKLNLIDLYSDENKPSFIFHDPLEISLKKYKDSLEQKGYIVKTISISEQSKSFFYNILSLDKIKDKYRTGDIEGAKMLCNTLVKVIYNDSLGKNKFWEDMSMVLLRAVIFSMLETKRLIDLQSIRDNIFNLVFLEGKNGIKILDEYFENMPLMTLARLEYKKIGYLDDDVKKSICLDVIDNLEKFNEKVIPNKSITLKELGIEDRPVAVFLATPNIEEVSSIFIKELYVYLIKIYSNPKYKREVIFNLDNFDSIYEIEKFNNILQVCLASGIKFNIAIKSLSKLEKIYGENFQTIFNNCGNIIYFSSDDCKTKSLLSEQLNIDQIILKPMYID